MSNQGEVVWHKAESPTRGRLSGIRQREVRRVVWYGITHKAHLGEVVLHKSNQGLSKGRLSGIRQNVQPG
eukprot:5018152-Amphidinium_carterae.1